MRKKTWIFCLLTLLGIVVGLGQAHVARADDDTQDTPPEKVTLAIHKLMYDKSFDFNVAVDGIKNDGFTHDLPKGIAPFNKDYGDVSFTVCNITKLVLPTPDSDLTNAEIDKITEDVQKNGNESAYVKNATTKTTATIDPTGAATFSNQEGYTNGQYTVYLVYESQSASGLVVQKAKPMVVVAPMTDNKGEKYLKTIHLYPKNIVQKVTFDLMKLGEDGTAKEVKTPLKEAKFSVYKGDVGKGQKLGDVTTDAKGRVTVQNLTVGSYYFVEIPSSLVPDPSKNPTSEQYLLGADARNDVHNKLAFTITPAGVEKQLTGSYINYKGPYASKKVLNGTGKTPSFQIGDCVKYEGTLHLPNDVGGGKNGIEIDGKEQDTTPYSKLSWQDKAAAGLTYAPEKAALQVSSRDGKTVLVAGKDYTVETKKNGFLLNFIVANGHVSDAVQRLHGQDLIIHYNMYVNDQAKPGVALPNQVDVTYNNDPYVPDHHDVPAHTDVYTYGAKFIKEDSGLFGTGIKATPLQGADFIIQNSDGHYYGGLKDLDGRKQTTWVTKKANAQAITSGKDGLFEITGFAEGTYQLLETKAPKGYQKLLKAISFKVNANSYQTNQQVVVKNNQKNAIPNTGSQRVRLFEWVAGALLILVIVIVWFTRRHRKGSLE